MKRLKLLADSALNDCGFNFWSKPGRVRSVAATMLLACAWIGLTSAALSLLAPAAMADDASETAPVFMFVQTADSLEVNKGDNTLRLVNVNQQTLFFSDRPERIAGHLKMDDYLQEWTSVEDDFDDDPPNASLSVYEPGNSENTVVVIEITNPVVDGRDLVYTYNLIDGTMPEGGGQATLFIDRIGIGGGVGAGYHGVGVGRRGPGVR